MKYYQHPGTPIGIVKRAPAADFRNKYARSGLIMHWYQKVFWQHSAEIALNITANNSILRELSRKK